ncbi:MAG: PilW family protein, partial [Candidatus Rokuibacteriota bacterium]
RGMTLAELLVGSALSMIVIGAVYSFYSAQTQALAAQRAYARSQDVTRTVIDLLGRELRMATYDPSGAAISTSAPGFSCPGVKQGLLVGKLDEIKFVQDLNGDGDIVDEAENLHYYALGGELRRVDGLNAPVVLVEDLDVSGFVLRYFDNSNPPIELVPSGSPPTLSSAQRDCVAKVRMTVRASVENPNPQEVEPLEAQSQAEVAIRNRSLSNF